MLQNLLADHHIIRGGGQFGVACCQIADKEASVELLVNFVSPVDVSAVDVDGAKMRPSPQMKRRGPSAGADVENGKPAPLPRRGAGEGVNVMGERIIARLAEAVALRTPGIDAKGEAARRGFLLSH